MSITTKQLRKKMNPKSQQNNNLQSKILKNKKRIPATVNKF